MPACWLFGKADDYVLRSRAKSSDSVNYHQLHWLERISGQKGSLDHLIQPAEYKSAKPVTQLHIHWAPRAHWPDQICDLCRLLHRGVMIWSGLAKSYTFPLKTKNIWNWHPWLSSAQAQGRLCPTLYCLSTEGSSHHRAHCLPREVSLSNGTTQIVIMIYADCIKWDFKNTVDCTETISSFKARQIFFGNFFLHHNFKWTIKDSRRVESSSSLQRHAFLVHNTVLYNTGATRECFKPYLRFLRELTAS